jgi:hypothetical protein
MDDLGAGAGAELAARAFGVTEALYARCDLGIGTGPDKRVVPAPCITLLGVRVSSVDGTLCLPIERAASYMLDACVVRHALATAGLRAGVTRHDLAELVGKLEWWAALCAGAQQCLRTLHAAANHDHPVVLCHAAVGQLDVWRAAWRVGGFAPRVVLRADPLRPVVVGASDAGDFAVAARAGARAVWHRLSPTERAFSSTRREVLGLRLLSALLAPTAPGTTLLLLCDNGGACAGLNRHRSRAAGDELDDTINGIHAAAAAAGVAVVACHVPREELGVAMCDVLADAPSASHASLLFRAMGGAELAEV